MADVNDDKTTIDTDLVIIAKRGQGVPWKLIARELNISPDTAKKRYRRYLRNIAVDYLVEQYLAHSSERDNDE